jgi:hypothetical protein
MRAITGHYAIAGLLLGGAVGAQAQDLAATLGKQRAAGARVEWEIREAGHPVLGNIRFAYVKRPIETPVGNATVFSRAYLSCQKGMGKLAIELSNAMAPADPGGLRPASDPRLVCNRPTAVDKVEREEILATWSINEKIGDALTQGLRPFPLRECAAINVVQEVTLPAGSAQKTARIEFELLPYNRELDSIFVTCGERSAYGPGEGAPVVAAATPPQPSPPPAQPKMAPPPPAQPQAAPAPAQPKAAPAPPAQPGAAPVQPTVPPASDNSWRSARAVPTGMTNVRSGPTLQSPIVIQLYPGAVVQVQRTAGDWWRARTKTPKGVVVEGFIREDRLVFK